MISRSKTKGLFFSRILLVYTACVILSAPFGRAAHNWLVALIGKDSLSVLIWCVFGACGIALGFAFTRSDRKRLVMGGCIVALGCLYASGFSIIEERMHLVIFGVVGFLFVYSNSAVYERRSSLLAGLGSALLHATVLGASVGTVDELLQSITPGRVGDVRDVFFNVLGSIWGAALALAATGNLSSLKRSQPIDSAE